MGELQGRLDEFRRQTGTFYQDIMNILEDRYCWKCPMRSTSKNSCCRNFWYVEIEDKQILPLESVFGVLLKSYKEEN